MPGIAWPMPRHPGAASSRTPRQLGGAGCTAMQCAHRISDRHEGAGGVCDSGDWATPHKQATTCHPSPSLLPQTSPRTGKNTENPG